VLLSGAGVLVAGFIRLLNRDLGFEPRQLLTFQAGLPDGRYSEVARIVFIEQLLEGLAVEPGVTAAAASMPLPLEGDTLKIAFDLEDRPSPPSQRPSSDMAIVTPGYFTTLGTTIVEGRDFTRRDDAQAPAVAIVNQAFVRRFFPNGRALGRRFQPGATDDRGALMREIVGMVANARQSPLGPEPEPIYYLPLRQMTWGQPSFVVRTSVPPMTLEPSVRRLVAGLDKDVPLNGIKAMEDLLASGTSVPRFAVTLMSAFSIIAIVLIATGVYGLLTYAVLRRTRELGIRLALGATRRGVVALVLTRAARLTATGLLLGVFGSVAIARVFARVFPESADPGAWLFPTAASIVTATSLLAAFMPATRAAAIDPIEALRRE
jgi:putative ABC transport system permease protein